MRPVQECHSDRRRSFVGSAGKLLNRVLEDAGIDTEIAFVKPRGIVCLGATAAQALLGRQFRVTAHRGEFVPSSLARVVMATVHPSSVLRAPDEEARREETRRLTDDLRKVARALSSE